MRELILSSLLALKRQFSFQKETYSGPMWSRRRNQWVCRAVRRWRGPTSSTQWHLQIYRNRLFFSQSCARRSRFTGTSNIHFGCWRDTRMWRPRYGCRANSHLRLGSNSKNVRSRSHNVHERALILVSDSPIRICRLQIRQNIRIRGGR